MYYFDVRFGQPFDDVDEYWGDKMPLMAIEELAELQQAIVKCERYKSVSSREDLLAEMADVMISIGALCHKYNFDGEMLSDKVVEKLDKKYHTDVNSFCEENGVDVRVTNCMLRTGKPLEWFATASEHDFKEIHNVGKKTVEELLRLQEILRNR